MRRSGGEFTDAVGGGARLTDWAGRATGDDAVANGAIGKPELCGIGIELAIGSTAVAMLGLGRWVGSARTTAGVTSPAGAVTLVAAECHSHKTTMAPAANEATANKIARA